MKWSTMLLLFLVCGAIFGCGKTAEPLADNGPVRTPADDMTTDDLERFLRIVRAHPLGQVPEFAASRQDDALDETLPAEQLVAHFREQFRTQFDPRRQGERWRDEPMWSKLLSAEKVSPTEFAGLVAGVSCAVARVRLDSRMDIDHLARRAEARLLDLTARIDRVDRLPPQQRDRDAIFERTQSVIQLGRTIALAEFAELLRQVPETNRTLVRQYVADLKPLLPATDLSNALAELRAWDENEPPSRQVRQDDVFQR